MSELWESNVLYRNKIGKFEFYLSSIEEVKQVLHVLHVAKNYYTYFICMEYSHMCQGTPIEEG